MLLSRRDFLARTCAAAIGGVMGERELAAARVGRVRSFEVCLTPDALERDPQLLPVLRDAGVTTVWLAGFFYGHWPFSPERLGAARRQLERAGLEVHVVNVPLGHPGDSLGATQGDFPLTPPAHWRTATRPDGKTYVGTSLHEPATRQNADAIRRLRAVGFDRFFVDDDFRLARSPGEIGGCFCRVHREEFLRAGGYTSGQWDELIEDVRRRRLSHLLRDWIEFHCFRLTESFRAQQRAAGRGKLGIMVMYLGAEKAGIRLRDYANAPFRVGELMFDDASFGSVKGKTDELFSALFHRRFARPDLAFSETTAFPADRLSARNLAAKLAVSTIADVRHTMFMSGVTPFPRAHWEVLKPAMKVQANHHALVAGHKPRGPFKHFWGEASRMVGNDQPFSLFLAVGVPFEVTAEAAHDGWTFLSNFDARAVGEGSLRTRGGQWVCRSSAGARPADALVVEESLKAMFEWKHRIAGTLGHVPHVEEDEPVVCAWYPSARRVLLWNLSEESRRLTVTHRQTRRQVEVEGLGTAVLDTGP